MRTRRAELRITSKKKAAAFCGISEAAYAAAEDPEGRTWTRDGTLERIADKFELDFLELRDLRDGRDPSSPVVTSDERALMGALDHLRTLPATEVRKALIVLINELHDALVPSR